MEVILLSSDSQPAAIARSAAMEDADAIIGGTYNGSAISLGEDLAVAIREFEYGGLVVFGGVRNQDTGEALPIDAWPALLELGIHCMGRIEDLGAVLAGARTSVA